MTDLRTFVGRLNRIESVARIPSVKSTNRLGRRVIEECLENDLPFPSAIIVAAEQTEGRGRADRTWFSPRDRGIWATLLHTRSAAELSLLPLEVAVAVARFLHDDLGVDARLKWPNDLYAAGGKIGGILIEARARNEEAFVLAGIGINLFPLGGEAPSDSTSATESSGGAVDLGRATEAFIETLDRELFRPYDPSRILDAWRGLAIHRQGDPIRFAIGSEQIEGTWSGIDDAGRARIETPEGLRTVAAGEIIEFTATAPE